MMSDIRMEMNLDLEIKGYKYDKRSKGSVEIEVGLKMWC